MQRPSMSERTSIRMGELAVALQDGMLHTLLGSCIGLALYDHRRRVAGLAHVVLPQSRGNSDPPGKFVDTAVPELREQMQQLAGTDLRLSARLAGGANMFGTAVTKTIGEQNLEATERLLASHGIPILARHVGGEQGRRMTLEVATGVVTIEIVGCEPVTL